MKLKNIKHFVTNPVARFHILNGRGFYKHLSDEKFIRKAYKVRMGKELSLENPTTYNEKLQWLKLNDRNPVYTQMVDKYEVKELVASVIGEEYIIPTLGIWERFEEIDFDKLPNQFVLKCTHNSGGLVICKDKSSLNIEKAKKKITRSLAFDYYYNSREWPYKNVKPRIIAEKYMENADGSAINDYKILCFDGNVDNIMVCVGRFEKSGVRYHYFDKEWNYLPYCPYEGINGENVNIAPPEKLNEMLEIAEKLSKGIPQLRVDLYEIKGQVYFGELTFFTSSGFDTTITEEADQILGSKLVLRNTKEDYET